MHILFLSDDYPSSGRPSFVFVQQLVHALLRQGAEISVVASQSLTHAIIHRQKLLPKKYKVELESGLSYYVYRPLSFSFGNSGKRITTLFNWFNQRNVDAVVNRINPDVLYGHFWHSANKLAMYAEKKRTPLFVACGEGDDALEELIASLNAESLHRLSKTVNGVISVSTENKRKCIEYELADANNIIVLPNCSDEKVFHAVDEQKRKDIRKQIGVKDDDFFILFVGGFIPRKGANRLSQAIEKLKDSQIKSAFIGKAMAGVDSQPSCDGIIYRAADVFVLPTLNEGCSNAIIEALSCGTPVVSSNRPFNADILNENNAILINPESVNEIAAAIQKLKDNKVFYEKIRAYTIAHSGDYSIKIRAEKIYQFICDKIK